MKHDSLLSRIDEHGILSLTIDRPASKNALTTSMQNALVRMLDEAARDPRVRVVMLTGAGGSFCSGGDRRALGAPDLEDPLTRDCHALESWNTVEARVERLRRCMAASMLLHTMGKPTIAKIRGSVVGAGLSLALACDFRVASTDAFFATGFARIGTSVDFGGSYFLTKLVGPSKAKEIFMLGDKIDSQEALRLGVIMRAVADADLDADAQALAARLAKGPPIAYKYIKENVQAAQDETIDLAFEREARNMVRCRTTNDSRIALEALEQKTDPIFQGT